ncbi:MAG: type II secretion system F family protein [Pirellulales bacterium]
MPLSSLIAVAATFFTVFLGICAANMVLTDLFLTERNELQHRDEILRRERERQRMRKATHIDHEGLSQLAQQAMNQVEKKPTLEMWLKELTEQSGWAITPRQVVILSIMVALGAVLAFWIPFRSPLLGAAAGLAGAACPLLVVSNARNRRLDKLRAQLPDALELMARILRAGQTVAQGMKSVSEEFAPPLGTEFGYCYDQQNLGLSPDIAFRELARRTGAMEIKIFVMAMMVHRQAGGNITELFDKLANIVRQRFRIRGEVRALTSEGRVQAMILLGLPVFMWLGLLLINRPYALELFDHQWLLWGTLCSMGLGAFWIHKIINFEF